ncbi:hypothetical protein NEOC65_002450 [Neochlamydia sp. AcF65]|nr:hypothetical protein [Neochlamydia sp. AcF65]MBS4171368.1 hypothetical protein [Neochlamydia sp. AcF95]
MLTETVMSRFKKDFGRGWRSMKLAFQRAGL